MYDPVTTQLVSLLRIIQSQYHRSRFAPSSHRPACENILLQRMLTCILSSSHSSACQHVSPRRMLACFVLQLITVQDAIIFYRFANQKGFFIFHTEVNKEYGIQVFRKSKKHIFKNFCLGYVPLFPNILHK